MFRNELIDNIYIITFALPITYQVYPSLFWRILENFGDKEHHMTFCLFTDIDLLYPYNPCTSKSDQQVISPYYTNTLSSI